MGLLTDENRVRFCFLENNKRMQRSLKELDKVNAYGVSTSFPSSQKAFLKS